MKPVAVELAQERDKALAQRDLVLVRAAEAEAEVARLAEENERLTKRREHTESWYAVRIERIRELAKERGIWDEVATILANGTADVAEPPTYAQQLNLQRHRADVLAEENERLREHGERFGMERNEAREEVRRLAEALKEATTSLERIRDRDWIENSLDPQWAAGVAKFSLARIDRGDA